MKMIVATAKDWGIGKNNDLLFSIPADMKFFRETTKGAVIIMGRKTLESFPNSVPLKGRVNIVLTTNPDYKTEAVVVTSKEDAIAEAKKHTDRDVFVIGGDSIYKLFEDVCDTAYVTRVDAVADADTFFINLDESADWELAEQSEVLEDNGYKFTFNTYKKVKGE